MRGLVATTGTLALVLAGCGPGTLGDGADEVGGSDSTSAGETSTSSSTTETESSTTDAETETSTASESSDTGEPICDEVHGDLVVDANTPLKSLACVREVGSLTLENSTLTDLSAFPALEDVDYLWIHDNPDLLSLAGANALVHVGQLSLRGQAQLSSLAGFAPDDLWGLVLGEGLDGLTSLDLAANVLRRREPVLDRVRSRPDQFSWAREPDRDGSADRPGQHDRELRRLGQPRAPR